MLAIACSRGENSGRGEVGGELDFLRKFHIPPQGTEESNHYFDLWSGSALAALARINGLTNNNTRFVDSHGKAGRGSLRERYVFYPSDELAPPAQKLPLFTARDLATVLGPESAARIHNIVLAGCNLAGALNPQEFRKYFVNATNITHTPAGQLGFKPMFFQAIVLNSTEIKTLYATPRTQRIGGEEYQVGDSPEPGSTRVSPYIAELFLPGAKKPFRTALAGREILEPARNISPVADVHTLLGDRDP